MKYVLENLDVKSQLYLASHNINTIELAKELIQKLDVKERVQFGQHQGFSDQITDTLAKEGYRVYKELPICPTKEVVPYLMRVGQ